MAMNLSNGDVEQCLQHVHFQLYHMPSLDRFDGAQVGAWVAACEPYVGPLVQSILPNVMDVQKAKHYSAMASRKVWATMAYKLGGSFAILRHLLGQDMSASLLDTHADLFILPSLLRMCLLRWQDADLCRNLLRPALADALQSVHDVVTYEQAKGRSMMWCCSEADFASLMDVLDDLWAEQHYAYSFPPTRASLPTSISRRIISDARLRWRIERAAIKAIGGHKDDWTTAASLYDWIQSCLGAYAIRVRGPNGDDTAKATHFFLMDHVLAYVKQRLSKDFIMDALEVLQVFLEKCTDSSHLCMDRLDVDYFSNLEDDEYFEFGIRESSRRGEPLGILLNTLYDDWPAAISHWQSALQSLFTHQSSVDDMDAFTKRLSQLFGRIMEADPMATAQIVKLRVMLHDWLHHLDHRDYGEEGRDRWFLMSAHYWPPVNVANWEESILLPGSRNFAVQVAPAFERILVDLDGLAVWCSAAELALLEELLVTEVMDLTVDNVQPCIFWLRQAPHLLQVDVAHRRIRLSDSPTRDVKVAYPDADLLALLFSCKPIDRNACALGDSGKENVVTSANPSRNDDDSTKPAYDEEPREGEARAGWWPFIKAMLTNLGPMTPTRIASTLAMFGGGPDNEPVDEEALLVFLEHQVSAGLLALDADSTTYRIAFS